MSETQTQFSERDEVEMLLPWYAAGTLSHTETERVEAYLDAHPDMSSLLARVRAEQAETIGLNESLGAPSPGALDRLMSAIEAESGPLDAGTQARAGLWQRLSDWIGGLSPRPLALATAAAIAVICVQAAVLGVLVTGDGSSYQTAAGGKEAVSPSTGTFALVGFAGTATADEINSLLEARGAAIVDGPMPGGLYRIRLSAKELDAEERDRLLAALRDATGVVRFAAPAK